jgi:uncharacterized protein GlcG (DUF336 family)
MKKFTVLVGIPVGLFLLALAVGCNNNDAEAQAECVGLPTNSEVKTLLQTASGNTGISAELGGSECTPGAVSNTGCVGGLFGGTRMWGAVVNQDGEICAFITSTDDPRDTLPVSQAIAKAKAYTANSVSTNLLPLSTARLYTLSQPGHSLFGLNNSNPFNPKFLAPPSGAGGGNGQIAGGIITFGGGVPLYDSNGGIIGAFGVSGDTACTDHEIAKRVRDLAGLNPPGGALADDIIYIGVDDPSNLAHPVCDNTVRNGTSIGNEAT